MIDPKTVVSPRAHWTLVSVLRQEAQWSLALGRWSDDDESRPCLAMRWNGADTPDGKGNPVSHGVPTWFIVPEDIYETLLCEVPEDKRRLACDVLGLTYENSAAFAAEAHRQSLAVARSQHAKDDQEFIDSVSDWSGG